MGKFSLTILCLLLLTASILSCDQNPVTPQGGEMVFFNGKIYTVNATQPWADAMYIKDGVIQFLGGNDEAREMASADAELIDLNGGFVMPGIHDVHLHPLEASSQNFQFAVNENINNPEHYADEVANAIQANPGNDWLLGWGHYLDVLLTATRSPKLILDDVAPNRPVAIMEQTSHSVWCNSAALDLMGLNANSTDPTGGVIMRDSNGEPNGILIDNAGNMLLDLALAPSAAREEADYQGLIGFGLPEMAKYGITSVCDARTYWKRNHHLVWQRALDEGMLTVRVNLGLWAYPAEDDATQIAMLKSLYSYDANSLLNINQIKLYSDGIVHNTTAAMHDNYLVDYFGQIPNNGLNYFDEARIADYIAQLEGTGFDFHIHALGNRGVHESLNAIEQSGSANGRHRLTHVEFVTPSDYGRFAQLNVIADAQVAGDFTQPAHWGDNDYLVGSGLTGAIIPLRSLKDAGARVTLSSDWDVSSLNPFQGLENAVTRDPQALTLEEAIKAYTLDAAYVMRHENKVGSLEVGKEADFILLDRDLFTINTNNIDKTQVLATYLRGTLVYER